LKKSGAGPAEGGSAALPLVLPLTPRYCPAEEEKNKRIFKKNNNTSALPKV